MSAPAPTMHGCASHNKILADYFAASMPPGSSVLLFSSGNLETET